MGKRLHMFWLYFTSPFPLEGKDYKYYSLYLPKSNSTLKYLFLNYDVSYFFHSGLGYIVGSGVAQAAGDWRWGVRTTPFLAYIALIILVIFLTDPPRGIF